MDDLSKELKKCKTGCMVGESLINHLIYADDLVVLSPYSAGLQQLLSVHYDIEFNSKMSVIINQGGSEATFSFIVFGRPGAKCGSEIQVFGLSDANCMHKPTCKCHMCTEDVKTALFGAYCTPLSTVHLWCSYSEGKMKKMQVAFNDAFRIL